MRSFSITMSSFRIQYLIEPSDFNVDIKFPKLRIEIGEAPAKGINLKYIQLVLWGLIFNFIIICNHLEQNLIKT